MLHGNIQINIPRNKCFLWGNLATFKSSYGVLPVTLFSARAFPSVTRGFSEVDGGTAILAGYHERWDTFYNTN